jgi:D-methionine transport system ATP-binding protein
MIRIQNLDKIFTDSSGSDLKVLDDVSLHIEKGDIVGIMGVSGAGKSTLMRCMAALEAPSSGSIHIAGKNLSSLNSKEKIAFYKEMGIIFQGYNLLMQKTVASNIALPLELSHVPKDEIEKKVTTLLQLVDLTDKKDSYPSKLSGGQKQRVAIARALANDPSVLLCDEPTSALDYLTTRSILGLLKDINTRLGITIVIITHSLEVVKSICDKIIVLSESKIVEQGPVKDVLSNPTSSITKQFLQ